MPGLNNRNQGTPKNTEEEYNEANKKLNEAVENLFDPIRNEFNEATRKYLPVVSRLTDVSFAALYRIVMAEKTRRMVRLYATVPGLAEHAMQEIAQRAQDGNN